MKKIFSVSDSTLTRWNGRVVPAALKLGGKRFWNARAVAGLIERGGPK